MSGAAVDPGDSIKLDELMRLIAGRLAPWCEARSANHRVAGDVWHALDILAASPLGLIAVLYWGGDDDNGQEMGLCVQDIRLVLSRNKGLGVDPGANLTGSAAKEALYALVDDLRAWMRGGAFPANATSQALDYRGTSPFVMPEGAPLDAYEMRFAITAAIALQEGNTP
ncbi:MAG TPA: hypothetical protein PLU30_24585 [Verrucomicrobiae bacterium]|nr:hypothetical protein [Verrucomicrobiae bacterium]